MFNPYIYKYIYIYTFINKSLYHIPSNNFLKHQSSIMPPMEKLACLKLFLPPPRRLRTWTNNVNVSVALNEYQWIPLLIGICCLFYDISAMLVRNELSLKKEKAVIYINQGPIHRFIFTMQGIVNDIWWHFQLFELLKSEKIHLSIHSLECKSDIKEFHGNLSNLNLQRCSLWSFGMDK